MLVRQQLAGAGFVANGKSTVVGNCSWLVSIWSRRKSAEAHCQLLAVGRGSQERSLSGVTTAKL